MIVALAGSNDMSSAKAARGSLAIASWSVTYGITDEQMPTPQPDPSRGGWENATEAAAIPAGLIATAAMSMAAASRSMPGAVGEPRRIAELAASIPEVTECYRITPPRSLPLPAAPPPAR